VVNNIRYDSTQTQKLTYMNNDWFKRIRVQVANVAGVTCEVELPVEDFAQTTNLE